jgi:DNA-binding IclR family transcriptional regulator
MTRARSPGAAAGPRGTVHRLVAVLELIRTAQPAARLGDMVATLGIPRSTAYMLIKALAEVGFVRRDGSGYRLGPRIGELGLAQIEQASPLGSIAPAAARLRDQTAETVQVSVLHGDRVLIVDKADGRQPVSIVTRVGDRHPVNWSAAGRLLVSDLDDHALRAALPRMTAPSPTGLAPLDPRILIAEIRRDRRRGHAWQINRSGWHMAAVAAPVLDPRGRCVAVLSIVVPEHRARARRRELTAAVVQAAATASAQPAAYPEVSRALSSAALRRTAATSTRRRRSLRLSS